MGDSSANTDAAKLAALQGMDAISIDSSAMGDSGDAVAMRQAGQREFLKAKSRASVNPIRNRHDGRNIQLNLRGFREVRQHSADTRMMRLMPKIDTLLREAIPLWSSPNTDTRKRNIRGWHVYGAKVDLDGESGYAKLLIREDANGNFFYDGDFTSAEMIEGPPERPALIPNQAVTQADLPENSIAQWAAKVQQNSPKQPPSPSMLRDLADRLEARGRERLRGKGFRLFAGLDPTLLVDYAMIGAAKILRGTANFSQWSAAMTKQFGRRIEPHLREIFDLAQRSAESIREQAGERRPLGMTGLEATFERMLDAEAGKSKPPVKVTGQELGSNLTDIEIRQAARRFAMDKLRQEGYENKATGRTIKISRGGIDKILASSADIRRAKMLAKVPELIAAGRPASSNPPDAGDRPNVRAYHYFDVDVDFEGKRQGFQFLVREDNNGDWYYNHEFTDTKKAPPVTPGGTPSKGTRTTPAIDRARKPSIDPQQPPVKENPRGGGPRRGTLPTVHAAEPTSTPGTGSASRGEADFARTTAEGTHGKLLLARLQNDPRGERVGVRSISEFLLDRVSAPLLVGKSQTSQKHPAHYQPKHHIVRSRSASWQLNLHEAGHAISAVMSDRHPDWMRELMPALESLTGAWNGGRGMERGRGWFVSATPMMTACCDGLDGSDFAKVVEALPVVDPIGSAALVRKIESNRVQIGPIRQICQWSENTGKTNRKPRHERGFRDG